MPTPALPPGFEPETSPPPPPPPGFEPEAPTAPVTSPYAAAAPNVGVGSGAANAVVQNMMNDYTDQAAARKHQLPVNLPKVGVMDSDMASGVARGAAKTVIGLKDIASKYTPGASSPESKPFQTLREFANLHNENAEQAVGEAGENLAEFMSGDELLSLIPKGLKGVKAFDAAGKIAKVLEETPALAALVRAGKQALIGGAQTFAKTGGDVGSALISGGVTGLVGGVLEGGGLLGKASEKITPGTTTIESRTMPILASQKPGGSTVGGATTANTPKFAAAQQEGSQGVVKDIAQRATKNSIERLNASRPPAPPEPAPITDPNRMLPTQAGSNASKPFFTIEGPPTYEDVRPPSGSPRKDTAPTYDDAGNVTDPGHQRNVVVPARAKHIGTGVEARPEGNYDPTSPSGPVRKVPLYQYLTDVQPGAEPIPLDKGGGTLSTNDPHMAQLTFSRLDDLVKNSSTYGVPTQDLAAITAARDSLKEQLDLYHGSYDAREIAGPHFPLADHEAAMSKVSNFGEAADQVQLPATPVYQRLDELSNGDFTKWNDQRKRALDIIRNPDRAPITEAQHTAAQQSLNEADGEINRIFENNKKHIAPGDWKAASDAWRDGKVLENVHTAVERAFNTNDAPVDIAAKMGRPRTMRGDNLTENINKLIHKGLPDEAAQRAEVERVIGADGLENLYRVGDLLRTPEAAYETKQVAHNIGMYLVHRGGAGATAGALTGLAMGGPAGAFAGGLTGAGTEAATRYVLRQMAINPTVAKNIQFILRSGARPEYYGPLVAQIIQGVSDNKPAKVKP